MTDHNCPVNSPGLSGIEVVTLQLENGDGDYLAAAALANKQAARRFKEFMLISWYDKDRDLESPPHSTECPATRQKDGYISYGLSHDAKLKVDIEDGRFVFFFTPVIW
ncbi:MAG: hypothetical protein GXP59_06795 [Deltaproteobacteria bacterium]|nr:hypothetical protein [Deltaproteobacteria bacterium]